MYSTIASICVSSVKENEELQVYCGLFEYFYMITPVYIHAFILNLFFKCITLLFRHNLTQRPIRSLKPSVSAIHQTIFSQYILVSENC